jgi:signal transduction histidine kinase
MSHGYGYLGPPGLAWIQVASAVVIAIAYFAILFVLYRVIRRRRDLRFGWLAMCFGGFLLASGSTSLLDVFGIGRPAFWLGASIDLIAAVLSVPTVLLLWRSLPDILTLPSRRELRAANESLARANRELEAFTASVSHDLRSPLTTIAGQTGLLERSLTNPTDEQRRRIARIQGGVHQMSELIDALLSLSRISRHTLHREFVDVTALAESIIGELRQAEPSRHIATSVASNLRAHGDRRLIGDLLRNLIGNAWKFTSRTPNARIEVGCADEGFLTTLYVKDNGAGFDMAHAQKLFQPFRRLHDPTEFPGSGVGLATVARIVERHGGRIWADAKPSAGASFYFTLPTQPMITGEFPRDQAAA